MGAKKREYLDKKILGEIAKKIHKIRKTFGEPHSNLLKSRLNENKQILLEREKKWNAKAWEAYKESNGEWGWPETEYRKSPLRNRTKLQVNRKNYS